VYTDGLHLLSLFQGRIPGLQPEPVTRVIAGDSGEFHLRGWQGQGRDFVLVGEAPPEVLEAMAGYLEAREARR
jgi:hypothetical protein